MRSTKQIIQLGLIAALCAVANSALAEYETNDNYSSFVISFKTATFTTPICFGGECHQLLAGPSLLYAKQVLPNLAMGMAATQLQSHGKSTSIKSTDIAAFVEALAGVGGSFDVGTSFAVLNSTIDLCTEIPNYCSTTSDYGGNVGVFGKAFVSPSKNTSLTLSYNSIVYQNSPRQSIVGLALVSILAKHHRLALSVDRVNDSNGNEISGGLGLGYSYLLYY